VRTPARHGALALIALALVCRGTAAWAAPISLGGLTFSDELGGFELLSASGSGTLEDPFILRESMVADGGGTLVIRGLSPDFGNRIGTLHQAGFALTKQVINHTSQAWSAFTLELQETRGTPSDYFDGLSFGQGSSVGKPFLSNRFQDTDDTEEPHDSVSFRDGKVAVGESVTFTFVITDATPVSPIFLVQEPTRLVAAKEPALPVPYLEVEGRLRPTVSKRPAARPL
jgi:hypothetical protein